MTKVRSAHFLLVVWFAVVGSWSCSFNPSAGEQGFYPGRLRIERGKNLSPEEREIEARFAKDLEQNTDRVIARYQEEFGNEINTDNARELSTDYAPGGIGATDSQTQAARASWSNAVHEPASALVKEIYRRELTKPAGPNNLDLVVFTAGGTAAGKTTAIKAVPGVANVVRFAQIIYDSTLSSSQSSLEKIAQALDASKAVSIVYVYRDPLEAFVNGALSQSDRMGRAVPLDVFLHTHINAPKVVLQTADKYKGDPKVAISVIDNSRGRGKAVVADLNFIREVTHKYTPEGLRAKVSQALEDAYEKGKRGETGGISEAVYRAVKGDAAKGIYGSPG
ncbi:MAG: hypothetical protein WD688_25395 [Candidatus Binatia bacterium]